MSAMTVSGSRGGDGFTLIEVMVALAVVALALPALLASLYQEIDGTAYIRDKAIAHTVAANKLTELRLLARGQGALLQGRESGAAAMAGRDWYWRVESKPTEVNRFYRVEISVADSEQDRDRPLYTLVAFFSADLGEFDDQAP